MKSILTFVLVASTLSSSFAGVLDVVSSKASDKGIVEVKLRTANGREQASFLYCKNKDVRASCKHLGDGRKFYDIRDLEDQKQNEEFEIVASAAGDVAVGVVLFFGGLVVASTAVSAGAAIGTAGVYTIGASSAIGGIAASQLVDALNPYEQYQQSQTLSDEVVSDKLVAVESSVAKFAKRLDTVLKKIK